MNVYVGEDDNEGLMEDDGYVHLFMFWDKLHVSDNDSVIAIVSRYDEDSKDGPSDCTRSSPDLEGMFDEDKDEEALEIRNPSSRWSSNFVPLHHGEDMRDGILPLVLEFP